MTPAALPLRCGEILISDLIDLYMAHYAGRDPTRLQRLSWWLPRVGALRLDAVSDDHVHAALEELVSQRARYFAGHDADGAPIYKGKKKPIAPATINRYAAALAAVFTWAIHKRIAPKGWDHPCRRVERRPENNGKTRFLTRTECDRLLLACKDSTWPKLYALVLLAITTGGRKGELIGLRWGDLDFDTQLAHVGRSKNGDPKALPIMPAVIEQLTPLREGPGALVFASKRNPQRAYSFELKWAEALVAAGIRGFRFHDLRHTCASFLAQNGATLLEIGDLLGHRQISMTKRYSHLASTHRAALVTRVLGDLR